MRISTGYLTGNVLAGDLDGIDIAASLARHDKLLLEAIVAEFPRAEIALTVEDGEGCLPYDCQTRVYDDEDVQDEEAEADVNETAGRVYAAGDFWVYTT